MPNYRQSVSSVNVAAFNRTPVSEAVCEHVTQGGLSTSSLAVRNLALVLNA